MIVCNLYPFEEAIQKPSISMEDAIEMIDIGGPTMIRAAAKNYKHVTVVSKPEHRPPCSRKCGNTRGNTTLETRLKLATEVFSTMSFTMQRLQPS